MATYGVLRSLCHGMMLAQRIPSPLVIGCYRGMAWTAGAAQAAALQRENAELRASLEELQAQSPPQICLAIIKAKA